MSSLDSDISVSEATLQIPVNPQATEINATWACNLHFSSVYGIFKAF